MNTTRLKITNRYGTDLSVTVDFPSNQKAYHIAIFSHCFTCHSNINAVRNINRALNKNGIAVVRFDFTGLGRSSGNFSDSHFEANVEDLLDVHEHITKEYFAPELIIGHSLGGSAAIVAASLLPNIKAVSTIGSPSDVEHTTKHFRDQLEELEETGKTSVQIGGRNFVIDQGFVDGFKKHKLPEIIKSLHKPILIFHSPVDETVSIDNAQEIYQNAMHPKSFISLDKADHLLTNREDSLYVGEVISSWAIKYLPKVEKERLDPDKHELVAHLNAQESKFTTTINTDNHGLTADEPTSLGGNNYGMAPYELVTAGLASCTVMTVNMYAQRKEWDLEEVMVYMSHSKEKREGEVVDIFKKELVFKGNLDQQQRNRLVEIAAKCPVHKTLSKGSLIETVERD
ncbi:MAG: OsmC family protein [Cytophagales bacterium]|nr:OsmC family protein [Cytophagales bacterium]